MFKSKYRIVRFEGSDKYFIQKKSWYSHQWKTIDNYHYLDDAITKFTKHYGEFKVKDFIVGDKN